MVATTSQAGRKLHPSEVSETLRYSLIGQPVQAVEKVIDTTDHFIEVNADGTFGGGIWYENGDGMPKDMIPVRIDGDRVRPGDGEGLVCDRDELLTLGWYQSFGDDEWHHEDEEE